MDDCYSGRNCRAVLCELTASVKLRLSVIGCHVATEAPLPWRTHVFSGDPCGR